MKLTPTQYEVIIEEGAIDDPSIRFGDGMTDMNKEFQEWIWAVNQENRMSEPVPSHLVEELFWELDNSIDKARDGWYLENVGEKYGRKARRCMDRVQGKVISELKEMGLEWNPIAREWK